MDSLLYAWNSTSRASLRKQLIIVLENLHLALNLPVRSLRLSCSRLSESESSAVRSRC